MRGISNLEEILVAPLQLFMQKIISKLATSNWNKANKINRLRSMQWFYIILMPRKAHNLSIIYICECVCVSFFCFYRICSAHLIDPISRHRIISISHLTNVSEASNEIRNQLKELSISMSTTFHRPSSFPNFTLHYIFPCSCKTIEN